MSDAPLAFFLTFTVYGTFLQGDSRWWRSRGRGPQRPQPLLEQWHRDRLNHDVILLDESQRSVVEHEVVRLSEFRGWTLWKISVRSNHVHVVVTATNANGSKIRDQIKANCTRALREKFTQFIDRPVWSVGGDWKCINTDEDLGQVILYASEVQDRKDRDS